MLINTRVRKDKVQMRKKIIIYRVVSDHDHNHEDHDSSNDDDSSGESVVVGAFPSWSLFSLRFLCPYWPSLLSAHKKSSSLLSWWSFWSSLSDSSRVQLIILTGFVCIKSMMESSTQKVLASSLWHINQPSTFKRMLMVIYTFYTLKLKTMTITLCPWSATSSS